MKLNPTSLQNWLLNLISQKIEKIEINQPRSAHFFCSLIPQTCPFEKTIKIFGRKLFHIPPLCKINPFYDQLIELRFRALSFLADVCQEDISKYCC